MEACRPLWSARPSTSLPDESSRHSPDMTDSPTRVQYHQLLGSGMQLNLTAVQVFVTTESSILSESPRVDILLLRREGEAWNQAQRARLPDGIRDSPAEHVLVEFKYTESVTEDGILQAAAYDLFYRQVQRLSKEQTLPVVLSAKTPQKSRLGQVGIPGSAEWRLPYHYPLCWTRDAVGAQPAAGAVPIMPMSSSLQSRTRKRCRLCLAGQVSVGRIS